MAYASAGIRSDHESTTADGGPGQGRAGDAGPGPRGVARAEPRRAPAAAGLGRDRRVVVPGHRRHLPRRPPPARAPRRPAPPPGRRGRPARGRRPPRLARPRPPLRPAPTAGPSPPATGPTWWSWTTWQISASTWSSRTAGSSPATGATWPSIPRRGSTAENTVRIAPIDESAFRLPLRSPTCPAIRVVPDQIVTRFETRRGPRRGRRLGVRPGDRRRPDRQHRAAPGERPGRPGAGRRLGADGRGAHRLVGGPRLAQPDRRRDRPARHARLRPGPGRVRRRVRRGGRRRGPCAVLPLPVAGLLSTADADAVCGQLDEVHRAARSLGLPAGRAPFGTLSFLALPVIPELRITARGLFDVRTQQFLSDLTRPPTPREACRR